MPETNKPSTTPVPSQHCAQLIASCKTLTLATRSADGPPLSSYAPFACDEHGVFYIFISDLAEHSRNLRATAETSVMIIRDESESKNLFARERAVFRCQAKQIDRDDAAFEPALQILTDRLGETIGLLRGLADFRLFALVPKQGHYVAGFGQAFAIEPETGTFTAIQRN